MCKCEFRILTVGRSCRSVEIWQLAPMLNCGCYTMHPLPGLKHSETGIRFVLLGGFHSKQISPTHFPLHFYFINLVNLGAADSSQWNINLSISHIAENFAIFAKQETYSYTAVVVSSAITPPALMYD
jgi:hypothetical protein